MVLDAESNWEEVGTPVTNGLRAIVADDDPFARRMIKDALQRASVVVIAEAQNGREAVASTISSFTTDADRNR